MQDAGQLSSVRSARGVGCRSCGVANTVRQARCVRARARALIAHALWLVNLLLGSFLLLSSSSDLITISASPFGYSYATARLSHLVRNRLRTG